MSDAKQLTLLGPRRRDYAALHGQRLTRAIDRAGLLAHQAMHQFSEIPERAFWGDPEEVLATRALALRLRSRARRLLALQQDLEDWQFYLARKAQREVEARP